MIKMIIKAMKLNEKNQIRKSSCGDKRIDPELSTSFLPVRFRNPRRSLMFHQKKNGKKRVSFTNLSFYKHFEIA